MPARRNNFYDRLQERLDRLDPASLRRYLQQAISEKGFFEEIFDTLREDEITFDGPDARAWRALERDLATAK